jgi:hypothetical protein
MTFVLLRPPIADLNRATIDALIQRYRLNEIDYDPSWRYDYWTVGDGNIADPETAAALGLTGDEDYGSNVCFVSRIGGRGTPGNIVTPDGRWHGLFDFGWKFRERDLPVGQEAYARWCAHAAEVLAAHQDCVAVEIDTHS